MSSIVLYKCLQMLSPISDTFVDEAWESCPYSSVKACFTSLTDSKLFIEYLINRIFNANLKYCSGCLALKFNKKKASFIGKY